MSASRIPVRFGDGTHGELDLSRLVLAVAAAYIPARRATQIDPAEALCAD